jgi:uncharacterized protein YheU (UPF0270 family)
MSIDDDLQQDADAEPVEVPMAALSADVLRGIVEHFVLREGTDYGPSEATFESKIADVMRQLERREARIFYDPRSETVTLVPA